jgi:flagella basal body P-ring formation protein FlgA
MKIPIWLLAAAPLWGQCLPVEGEFIRAAQLSASNPGFSALPDDTPIARAPVAGARLVLRPDELQRLAGAHQLRSETWTPVCFEWPMSPLDTEHATAILRENLEPADARMEVLDLFRGPAPPGEVVFPRPALSPAGNASYLWRGYVRYGEDRRYPIWARLRIWVTRNRVVARQALAQGSIVTQEQVETKKLEAPFYGHPFLSDPADAIGKRVRRSVREGEPLVDADLTEAPVVAAGQAVEVEVRNGPLCIRETGQVEQSGRKGDMVMVRNTRSGAKFRARVESAGRVTVTLSPAHSGTELPQQTGGPNQ